MISDHMLNLFDSWQKLLFTEYAGQDICDEYLIYNKKIIISDCDGILTDGGHYYTESGKKMKRFGSCDKEAMRFMMKCKWKFLFVTDDPSGHSITGQRLKDWNVSSIRLSDVIKEYWTPDDAGYELTSFYAYPDQAPETRFVPHVSSSSRVEIVKAFKEAGYYVVFLGDSMSDLAAAEHANLFCTIDNALDLVKENADIVSNKCGGFGGFADLMYKIHWMTGNQYSGIPSILEKVSNIQ